MASADSLHARESRRRRTLWIIAHLDLGDPRAPCALRVLDEIDQQEQASPKVGRIGGREPRRPRYPFSLGVASTVNRSKSVL